MKFCGIICEFNPLHNGHQYLIEQAKKETGLPIICIMSGNFTQRAEPAIFEKHIRASHAIKAGANIVIELPTVFATSSAEDFSFGAIKILNSLGCVEKLCFGSECGDIEKLQNVANMFKNNAKIIDFYTKLALNNGKSYPVAIQEAISNTCKELKIEDVSSLLNSPNNLLGIEYLKQLNNQQSKIIPITIKRIGEGYKSNKTSPFSSASLIRESLLNNKSETIKESIPSFVFEDLDKTRNFEFIKKTQIYNIKLAKIQQIAQIYGICEGLEFRIKSFDNSKTLEELIEKIKTKRYTHSKIRRVILNNTLNITKQIAKCAKTSKPYANILMIKNKILLGELNHKKISIIYSNKDIKTLNNNQLKIFNVDKNADTLFNI